MKKEFLIGLSAIAALFVVAFGINYLKGINLFKAANYYTASYTNAAGLAQSAPVNVNGYKVGLVSDIKYEYDNPGHILVEISLDKELDLPKGTKAVLVTDMLGTSSITLEMGTSSDMHKSGDRLIAENAVGMLDNVSKDMLPAIINMLPKIDSILVALNTTINNPAITSSVEHMERIMANLETSSIQLNKMMATMPAIATDAKEITGNLTTMSADLSQMTARLNAMPIDSTMQNIHQTSESLKILMAQLNNPNSSLGAMIHDRGLYNNLNNSAASLDSLLQDVKKNPKRYIHIKVF